MLPFFSPPPSPSRCYPAGPPPRAPTYLTQWGSLGGGNGQFRSPGGVAVDGIGNVYVADGANCRIQKFTSTGTYLTQWGMQGGGDGQFYYPQSVAVDGSGNVYVADAGGTTASRSSPAAAPT